MQVTVVVENFCTNRLLRAEWGYSLYLESDKTRLLLDTGSEGHAFTHNLKALQINPKAIEHIVFSHAHVISFSRISKAGLASAAIFKFS